jgi:hypothetical protein
MMTRRDFARLSALSLLGVACAPLLPAANPLAAWDAAGRPAGDPRDPQPNAPTAKNLIYLYMSGGMSHLDTFDTKPGQAVQGPTQTISTAADGVRIAEYFPLLAKQMKHVAVVNSLSSNQGAHEQGNYFMHTSYNLRGTIRHPALGSWLLNFSGRTNSTIPGNVVIGGGSNYPGNGYLDPRYAPILLGRATDGLKYSKRFAGISDDEFSNRNAALDALNKAYADKGASDGAKAYQDVYDEALALMKSSDLQAFSIADESKPIRDAYGDTPFGQGCLLARRLVEHGVRYIEVEHGGWDTHADNFDRVADLAEVLDRGLSTLLADLHQRGMLDETMVVVTTEFGRSPEISDNQGRNHHPRAFSALLAGGGIRGGQVYGKSDATGTAVIENELAVPDFNATIAYGLGLPTATVVHSPSGRPFTIADKGRPALALFG